jgi:hypothetical protein
MSRKAVAPLRIALRIPEAAAALGFGETYFRREILPQLPTVRGSDPRVLVSDLQAWAEEHRAPPTAPSAGSGPSDSGTVGAVTSIRPVSKSSLAKSERVQRRLRRAGRIP